FYKDGYSPHSHAAETNADSKDERFLDRYGLWKRVKFISRYKSAGKWLDVGCGNGRLLQEASRWDNWQLEGLEPIEEVANSTKERLNIPVYPCTFEQLDLNEKNKFDIISMWDVLEHLPSPMQSLQHVNSLLKDDGIFVFTIPNYNSLDRRLFKNFWIGYDLPRHLYVYPHDILRKMLNKVGMRLVNSKCIAGTHAAFFLSLRFYNQKQQSKLLNNVLAVEDRIFPWRLLTLLPFWVIDKLKLSTNITFVAKKNK
ncbi:MAG: class I SAM-dependent methyltransferase, partial [Thermotogota bacterium]|nr:class I SAM-dependent methyltransferase [Thermotogota bacterium]